MAVVRFVVLFLSTVVSLSWSAPPCPAEYCLFTKCKKLTDGCNLVIQNATRCGCCPICITYADENDRCFPPSLSDVGISGEHCGPQLTCVDNTCQKKKTPCLTELKKYEEESDAGFLQLGKVKPTCTDEGNYHHKQCRPGSMCYCVDDKGRRIFGEIKNEAKYKDIGCACSRKFDDLVEVIKDTSLGEWTKSVNPFAHFMRCSATGDFEPLQCIGETCFCVGKDLKLDSNANVTRKRFRSLHCYNPEDYTEVYTRSCEDALHKALEYRKKQLEENKILIGFDIPTCDLDGSYAPKQCKEDRCICSDKDGNQIETYIAMRYSEEANKMKCECARENLFLQKQGLAKEMDCSSSGDYNPIQCLGGTCYCVDENGDQKGHEFDRDDVKTYKCDTQTTQTIQTRANPASETNEINEIDQTDPIDLHSESSTIPDNFQSDPTTNRINLLTSVKVDQII